MSVRFRVSNHACSQLKLPNREQNKGKGKGVRVKAGVCMMMIQGNGACVDVCAVIYFKVQVIMNKWAGGAQVVHVCLCLFL